MVFRPAFREALTLFAKAIQRLEARGVEAPILVGGAAVEFFTGGQITSGDFDFVSARKDEFFAELLKVGFIRPQGPGWLDRSLFHPGLGFGVQVVSGQLMDGQAERSRIVIVRLPGGAGETRLIPLEDLIADRMAQALAGPRIEKDMQNQSVSLYRLAENLDRDYLDRRIKTETGNAATLATLLAWSDENDKS